MILKLESVLGVCVCMYGRSSHSIIIIIIIISIIIIIITTIMLIVIDVIIAFIIFSDNEGKYILS